MDLQDQRIACLRMAIEMGCKPDSVVATATDLMNFITSAAPTVPITVTTPEVSDAERIAACGTEVPMTETADLALAVAVAAPLVASEEGMPESPPATDTVTEVAHAAVEPATPVSAAAPQEAAVPVVIASEEQTADEAPVAATELVESAPVTPPAEVAPVDATPVAVAATEGTPVELSVDPAPVVVEVAQPAASVVEAVPVSVATPPAVENAPVAPLVETVAATSPAPVAEAVVADQAPGAEATSGEATQKLDAEMMPAAAAANGAGNTDAASVTTPAN